MSFRLFVIFFTIHLFTLEGYCFLSMDLSDLKKAESKADSLRILQEIGDYAGRRERADMALISCLNTGTVEIRRYAVELLGEVKDKSKDVIRAISNMMEDPDPSVRRTAVAATESKGTFHSAFLQELRLKLCDPDRLVQEMTVSTFIDLGEYSFHPLGVVLEHSECEQAKILALKIIREIGKCPPDLFNKVKKISNSGNPELRKEALSIIKTFES